MNKTQAWAGLFSPKPKKGFDCELALSVIAGDKEPDADADAAFDNATRDRIQDFLMDADAFCQANSSDARVSFWRRMVPAPTVVPAAKPKATPKSKPVGALPAKPAPAAASAPVVLPPRKTGLNPNAVAAAARASTAPAAAPTLSLGNVFSSVAQPVSTPAANPTTSQAAASQNSAPASPTIIVAGTLFVAPPPSTEPVVLTEQAITKLIVKGKKPTTPVRAQLREEALQAACVKAQLEFDAAERTRRADEEAAERKRVREEQAAERKRLSDEAAADRKRLKDEADRKRQQAENVPKEEEDRRAAFIRAHTPPAEHVAMLHLPLYILCRESYTELCVKARSNDVAIRAQGQAQLQNGLTLLYNWQDGVAGRECAAIARHILRLIDELVKKGTLTDSTWFKCNFVTGKWEEAPSST